MALSEPVFVEPDNQPVDTLEPGQPSWRKIPNLMLLLSVLTMGAIDTMLHWNTSLGINWTIECLSLLVLMLLVWGGNKVSKASWALIASAAVGAIGMSLRASDWSLVLGIFTSVVLVSVIPFALIYQYKPEHLQHWEHALWKGITHSFKGFVQTFKTLWSFVSGANHHGVKSVALGLMVGLPLMGAFTWLLGGDPNFSQLTSWALSKSATAASVAFASIRTALFFLFMHQVYSSSEAEKLATEQRDEPMDAGPYRTFVERELATMGITIPSLPLATWSTILTLVTIPFALFSALQAKTLFRGHSFIRDTQSLTYSNYLHSGFYQLIFAAALSLAMLLAGHWALGKTKQSVIAGGKVVIGLELSLLALTGITLASCWHRLSIYEEAYGATYLRLLVGFVIVIVGTLLLLTALKSTFRAWAGYTGAVAITLGALFALASAFDADGYIARRNLDRASNGKPLDSYYLRSLSADACSALHHPIIQADENLRNELAQAWKKHANKGWRALRGVQSCE